VPTTDALDLALGFWLKRRSAGTSSNALYTGAIYTNAGPWVTFRSNDWQLIGWPLATPRREDAGAALNKGWGFAAAGARKGASWMSGDILVLGSGTNSGLLYLQTDGRWRWVNGTPAPSATLRALEAYYYLHRGTGFVWRAEEE
jgi:hypothetical protein